MRLQETEEYWLNRFPAQGYEAPQLKFIHNEIKSGAYNHRSPAEREAMQRAIEQLLTINQPQEIIPAAKQRKR